MLSQEPALKLNDLGGSTHRHSLRTLKKNLPLRVLDDKAFEHWQTYGYTVVRQAVTAELVERLKKFLWEFQDLDPLDPATWSGGQRLGHTMRELNNSGMVEAYNHQLLWETRQEQRVYDAFVDIWDESKLWVSIDRANLNTPNRDGRAFSGFIHTDVDTTLRPLPVGVQGVLSLVDSDPEIGGFQCVPELFRVFDEWLMQQRPERDGFKPDSTGFEIVPIAMKAGDLLIFNSLLAHGIRPNRSQDRVRMAQYISMFPAENSNEELRQRRIASWRERQAPQGSAFPGDPRNWERTRYPTADLSPLGRRLLGLDVW